MRCRKSAICGINTCAPKTLIRQKSRGHRTRWAVGQVGGEKVAGGKWKMERAKEGRKLCQVWRQRESQSGNVPRMNFAVGSCDRSVPLNAATKCVPSIIAGATRCLSAHTHVPFVCVCVSALCRNCPRSCSLRCSPSQDWHKISTIKTHKCGTKT